MWKQRLVRLFLLAGATTVVLLGAKNIVSQTKGKSVSLPDLPIQETLINIGSGILGKADKQPTENVQIQSQQLIESIKKLPADQLEAVKKQLLKEFCQQLEE